MLGWKSNCGWGWTTLAIVKRCVVVSHHFRKSRLAPFDQVSATPHVAFRSDSCRCMHFIPFVVSVSNALLSRTEQAIPDQIITRIGTVQSVIVSAIAERLNYNLNRHCPTAEGRCTAFQPCSSNLSISTLSFTTTASHP